MKNYSNQALSSALVFSIIFSTFLPLFPQSFVSPKEALAAIPQTINYQGKLLNASSTAVTDGTYNMEFKLYASSTSSGSSQGSCSGDSQCLWTETRTSGNKVTVSNGLFSVLLGSVTSLSAINFNQQLYLSINIGGTSTPAWDGEMTPKKTLSSVPSAFTAQNLNGYTDTQFFKTDVLNSTSSASTFFQAQQNGAGKIAEFFGNSTTSVLALTSGGLVGIGSSTPFATLSVQGSGGLNPFVVVSSTGTQLFTILANGNVGIGTTSPTDTLAVNGSLNLVGAFKANGQAGTLGQILQTTGSGTQWVSTSSLGIVGITGGVNGFVPRFTGANAVTTGLFLDNGTVAGVNATSSTTTFNVRGTAGTNPFAVASSSGTNLFLINQNGYVGIGSSTPNALVSILGPSASGNAPDALVVVGGNGTAVSGGIKLYGGLSSFGNGGSVDIRGGDAPDTVGGAVSITGGSATATGGSGADLTFTAGNGAAILGTGGKIILNAGSAGGVFNAITLATSGGNVGVGTTSPSDKFSVSGSVNISGALKANGQPGTTGQVLQSTGTGFQWVSTSSLAVAATLSGGINGYLARWTSASTIGTGLFIDNGTVAGISATSSTTTLNILGTGSLNPFNVASSTGANLFTLFANGNVGVGMNVPASKLALGVTATTLANVQQNTSNNGIQIDGTYGAGSTYLPGLSWSTSDNNPTKPKAGIWVAPTAVGSVMYLGTSNAYATGITNTAMIIDQTGQVGIGATPNSKLTVDGGTGRGINIITSNTSVTGSTGNLYLQNTSSVAQADFILENNRGSLASYGGFLYGGSAEASPLFGLNRNDKLMIYGDGASNLGVVIGTLQAQPVVFGTNNAERVRIDSAGNFGIGTTSPTDLLSVNGSLNLVGAFKANGQPGTSGQVLQTTGSGTQWVSTSSLGITAVLSGGTNGYLARWTSATALGTGLLLDNGTVAGINATSSGSTFNIKGSSGLNALSVTTFGGTNALIVDSNGNVGVGTSTIGSKLTIAGAGGTGSLGPAVLDITATDSGGYVWGSAVMAPNLTAGQEVISPFVGQSKSTNNSGFMGFKYAGAGSVSNQLTWGFYGNSYDSMRLAPPGGTVGLELMVTSGSTGLGYNVLRFSDAGAPTYGFGFQQESTATGDLSISRILANVYSQVMTFQRATGNVGIGTTSPTDTLSVNGSLNLSGAFKANGQAGTLGQILQTTGSGTQWVSTSSLGISGGVALTGGVNGFLARWTGASTLATSTLLDNGIVAGVNATSSSYSFNVQGAGGKNPFAIASSTGTQMLIVDQNGNVGINTATLGTNKLSVNGGYRFGALFGTGSGGIFSGDNTGFTFKSNTYPNNLLNVAATGLIQFGDYNGDVNGTNFSIDEATTQKITAYASGGYSFGGGSSYFQSNVGIGSSTPAYALVVSGTSSFQDIIPDVPYIGNLSQYSIGASTTRFASVWSNIVNVGSSTWSLSNKSGNRFSITDRAEGLGTEAFTILPGGNVGIGTTTPVYTLDVVGASRFASALQVEGGLQTFGTNSFAGNVVGGESTYWSLDAGSDRVGLVKQAGHIGQLAYGAGSQFIISQSDQASIDPLTGTFTSRFIVDDGGNVGINTSAPHALLSLGAGANAQKLLLYDNNDTNKYGFGIQGNEMRQFVPSDSHFSFGSISTSDGTTFAELARLDAVTGNFGVGGTADARFSVFTSSSSARSTNARFHNTGGGSNTAASIGFAYSENNNDDSWISAPFNGTYSSSDLAFGTGGDAGTTQGTEKLRILGNGSVGIGTTTPGYLLSVAGTTSVRSLIIGSAPSVSNAPVNIGGSVDGYYQVNIQNQSTGANASSDFVATANNGSDSTYYVDFGINGSGYNQSAYSIGGANDAYLYNSDAALSLGTASSTNTNAVIKFHTGGTLASNERMRITSTGLVAIGTTTPTSLFSVQGTSSAPTLNLLAIASSSGASFLTVLAGGNVGVGTSTPSDVFSVAGSFNLTGAFKANGQAGTLGQVLQTTGSGTQWVATSSLGIVGITGGINGFVPRFTSASAVATGLFLDNGTVAGINATTSTSTFNIKGTAGTNPFTIASSSGAQLLSLLQNGNLGLGGTTTPTDTLSVAGNFNLTGAFKANGNAGSNGQILQTTGAGTVWVGTSSLGIIPNTSSVLKGNAAGGAVAISNAFDVNTTQTMGDADVTVATTTDVLYLTAAFTAIRTVTLPAANAYTNGRTLTVITNGKPTISNYIKFIRGGADTLGGQTTDTGTQFQSESGTGLSQRFTFSSDGTSDWEVYQQQYGNSSTLSHKVYNRTEVFSNAPAFGLGAGFQGGSAAIQVTSTGLITFSNDGSNYAFQVATGLGKSSQGALEINSGTLGSWRDLVARNISLGTTSTSSVLTVQGTSSNPTARLFTVASSTGTANFVVLANGNVGIGTTTPNFTLGVGGDINLTGNLYQNGTLVGLGGSSQWTTSGASIYFNSTGGSVGVGTTTPASAQTLTVAGGFGVYSTTTNQSALFVNASTGNVGIGTTSPTERFTVEGGNIQIGRRANTVGAWTNRDVTGGNYVGGGTTGIGTTTAMAVYNGSMYVGTFKAGGAEVYRFNGSTYTKVSSSTAGAIGGSGTQTTAIDAISAMTVYDGMLYIGTAKSASAEVYRYDGNSQWTKISSSTAGAIGGVSTTTAINSISAMAVSNGSLFIGTSKTGKAEVYKYNPQGGTSVTNTWTQVQASNQGAGKFGAETAMDTVSTMINYQGFLFMTVNKANSANLYRYDSLGFAGLVRLNSAVGNWTDATNIDFVRSAAVYDGRMYFGIDDGANTARIVRWEGGPAVSAASNFTTISSSTSGTLLSSSTAQNIDRISSLAVYKDSLYAGIYEPSLAQVYKYTSASSSGWQVVSSSTAGYMGATGSTTVDGVSQLEVYNEDLWVGTEKAALSEAFSYNKSQDESYALQFNASASNSSSSEAELNGLKNLGSIKFIAGDNATNNDGNISTGKFLFSGGINTTTGAYDLAEDYPTRDETLAAGDVVSIDTRERGLVKKSVGKNDANVIGIYSEKPALRLTQNSEEIDGARAVPIALAGRVPVKVTLENGPIAIGDYLTISAEPGKAAKATKPGRVIGRALSRYSGAEGEVPTVTVFIAVQSVGWNEIQQAAADKSDINEELSSTPSTVSEFVQGVNSAISDIAFVVLNKADNIASLITNKMSALVANISSLFVKDFTLLPGGTFNLPRGPQQIVGSGSISVGQTSVHIESAQTTEGSLISITPTSAVESPLYVTDVVPGVGFTVRMTHAQTAAVTFNWFMINTYDPLLIGNNASTTGSSSALSNTTGAGNVSSTTSTTTTITNVTPDGNAVVAPVSTSTSSSSGELTPGVVTSSTSSEASGGDSGSSTPTAVTPVDPAPVSTDPVTVTPSDTVPTPPADASAAPAPAPTPAEPAPSSDTPVTP